MKSEFHLQISQQKIKQLLKSSQQLFLSASKRNDNACEKSEKRGSSKEVQRSSATLQNPVGGNRAYWAYRFQLNLIRPFRTDCLGLDVLQATRLNPCGPAINHHSQQVANVTAQVSGISLS